MLNQVVTFVFMGVISCNLTEHHLDRFQLDKYEKVPADSFGLFSGFDHRLWACFMDIFIFTSSKSFDFVDNFMYMSHFNVQRTLFWLSHPCMDANAKKTAMVIKSLSSSRREQISRKCFQLAQKLEANFCKIPLDGSQIKQRVTDMVLKGVSWWSRGLGPFLYNIHFSLSVHLLSIK